MARIIVGRMQGAHKSSKKRKEDREECNIDRSEVVMRRLMVWRLRLVPFQHAYTDLLTRVVCLQHPMWPQRMLLLKEVFEAAKPYERPPLTQRIEQLAA